MKISQKHIFNERKAKPLKCGPKITSYLMEVDKLSSDR